MGTPSTCSGQDQTTETSAGPPLPYCYTCQPTKSLSSQQLSPPLFAGFAAGLIPNPLYLQIIFKVEVILNLESPHVGPLSDPPHPRGLDLKNTLLFFSDLLVPARNEPKCSQEALTDELVEVVAQSQSLVLHYIYMLFNYNFATYVNLFQALQREVIAGKVGKFIPYIFMEWMNLRANV